MHVKKIYIFEMNHAYMSISRKFAFSKECPFTGKFAEKWAFLVFIYYLYHKLPKHMWGYSSVVESSTADREVPGSNPGAPFSCFIVFKMCHENHEAFDFSNSKRPRKWLTGISTPPNEVPASWRAFFNVVSPVGLIHVVEIIQRCN